MNRIKNKPYNFFIRPKIYTIYTKHEVLWKHTDILLTIADQ